MLKIDPHIRIALAFASAMFLFAVGAHAQGKYVPIKLPAALSSVDQEFSGLATHNGRVYFLPQYGGHQKTGLNGEFYLYSIKADSISRAMTGADTALTAYRTLKVLNLYKLPEFIKRYYEGFENITIVNDRVYMAIETTDSTTTDCYLLKGVLDEAQGSVIMDAEHYMILKRPMFIYNAGFEAVTYLPRQNKLLAIFEFNAAANGGMAYLIDPDFKEPARSINMPLLYFRLTDIATAKSGRLYGINYYWNGDYKRYFNKNTDAAPEEKIKTVIPALRDSLTKNTAYLRNSRTTFARVVTLKNYKAKKWKQVATFGGYRSNWEGITLFNKGVLVITDANSSKKQLTSFAYIGF